MAFLDFCERVLVPGGRMVLLTTHARLVLTALGLVFSDSDPAPDGDELFEALNEALATLDVGRQWDLDGWARHVWALSPRLPAALSETASLRPRALALRAAWPVRLGTLPAVIFVAEKV